MEQEEIHSDFFKSSTGKREQKGVNNNPNMGWYAFLFFIFLMSYAFFAFVYFK